MIDALATAPDDRAFRETQRALVCTTGAADAPFELRATESAREWIVAFWKGHVATHWQGSALPSHRADDANERWFARAVLPRLLDDPAGAPLALVEFGRDMAYPRVSGSSLEMAREVVRGLLLLDGERLAALLPADVDSATLRQRALEWAQRDPDERLADALAESLALPFPASAAHDLCFVRTQRALVELTRDSSVPLFPVPTDAGRDAAAGYWRARVGRRRGKERRHRVVDAWERATGVAFYEALVPLPREEAELEVRVTRFVLDVLARDPKEIGATWGVDVTQLRRKMNTELAAPYARRFPRAEFVPLLIDVLPRGDAHWDGWLVASIVAEVHRTLIYLTGVSDAPPMLRDGHRRRVSDFWHGWWADHGATFDLPPEEARGQARERWDSNAAPGQQRQRAFAGLARLWHPVAVVILGPIGWAMYVTGSDAAKYRGSRRGAWTLVWPLYAIVWSVVFFVILGTMAILRVAGFALWLVWLAITPWTWPRVWRGWRRARRRR